MTDAELAEIERLWTAGVEVFGPLPQFSGSASLYGRGLKLIAEVKRLRGLAQVADWCDEQALDAERNGRDAQHAGRRNDVHNFAGQKNAFFLCASRLRVAPAVIPPGLQALLDGHLGEPWPRGLTFDAMAESLPKPAGAASWERLAELIAGARLDQPAPAEPGLYVAHRRSHTDVGIAVRREYHREVVSVRADNDGRLRAWRTSTLQPEARDLSAYSNWSAKLEP